LEGKSFLPWLKVGAQNVHWASDGAFTGEVSPLMLRESGCDYVIIGHSERRQLFGESDEQVHQKTLSTVSCGLKVILCVGETLQERESGETLAVIDRQLAKALVGLSPEEASAVSVAYEPIWAIGTGRTAHSNEAQEVCHAIRCFAAKQFGEETSSSLRILYGGSVKPDNAPGLLSEPDIDGALVGGASLKVETFLQILSAAI
jgi:triosephosphate isomerase